MSDLLAELKACESKSDRLMHLPLLNPAEREVLRQLRRATWDGNVSSKSARDSLYLRGLCVRFNGWQVASELGLIVLDTLGWLDERERA